MGAPCSVNLGPGQVSGACGLQRFWSPFWWPPKPVTSMLASKGGGHSAQGSARRCMQVPDGGIMLIVTGTLRDLSGAASMPLKL